MCWGVAWLTRSAWFPREVARGERPMSETTPDVFPAGGGAPGGRRLTVALAGNPNSGKTTLFNNLTGSRQHVGNYPGVTVEKKEGVCRHQGWRLEVVDLPGTYSLTAYTLDERVARNFVIEERPDVVVGVMDASNLERNLYLAVQLMELGVPLVLAMNMSDVAESRGYAIDLGLLSELLGGVPLVPTVGNRNEGTRELVDAVVAVGSGRRPERAVRISYGREVNEEIERLSALLEPEAARLAPRAVRWVALKLLERDARVREWVQARASDPERVLEAASASVRHLESIFHDAPEMVIADRRYGFISGACLETVRQTVESRHTTSDRIDAVVTHPVAGVPIFLALVYLVFKATFTLGEYPMGWLETGFEHLGAWVGSLWPAGEAAVLRSLVVDGVIGGVGSVVVFLPNILLLFLAISVLEDSGYMARAAFIVDRWMHKIGLHGKSFIPMLIGFGCTVPAILSTRILESRRDRLTTMLVLPLMSCGARLPAYMLVVPAFFPAGWVPRVVFLVYVAGILLAIGLAKLLRLTVLRGEATPFVMELPPYRMPTAKGALLHMWDRGWQYLRKAGTVILAVAVVMWALASFPRAPESAVAGLSAEAAEAASLRHSVAGRIGRALEPVTRPLGFDWRVNTAMLGAFAAKEVFVAQMGIVYAMGDVEEEGAGAEALRDRLRADYTPLEAVAMLVVLLVGFPCVATVAVMWSETRSVGWTLLQWGGLTGLAYVAALAVYQVGSLLGLGGG